MRAVTCEQSSPRRAPGLPASRPGRTAKSLVEEAPLKRRRGRRSARSRSRSARRSTRSELAGATAGARSRRRSSQPVEHPLGHVVRERVPQVGLARAGPAHAPMERLFQAPSRRRDEFAEAQRQRRVVDAPSAVRTVEPSTWTSRPRARPTSSSRARPAANSHQAAAEDQRRSGPGRACPPASRSASWSVEDRPRLASLSSPTLVGGATRPSGAETPAEPGRRRGWSDARIGRRRTIGIALPGAGRITAPGGAGTKSRSRSWVRA